MKAWQRIIREQKAVELPTGFFNDTPTNLALPNGLIRPVGYSTASKIIRQYEWLGNMGITNFSYGIYFGGFCGGVVCFGQPARVGKYRAFLGEFYKDILQLTRGACVWWTPVGTASKLIGASLKLLPSKIVAVVAFSDPMAGEIGTVYQATNWLYTGKSTDGQMRERSHYLVSVDGKKYHLRTLVSTFGTGSMKSLIAQGHHVEKIPLTPKHRYFFLRGSHKENRVMLKHLNKWIRPYPKRAEDDSRESCPDTIGEGGVRFPDSAKITSPTPPAPAKSEKETKC